MNALHAEALARARELIRGKCGDLADLPEDVRNTVANVFYEFCQMQSELEGCRDAGAPASVLLASSLRTGLETFVKEAAFLNAAVDAIPDLLSTIRDASRSRDGESLKQIRQVFLDLFKYRIPDYAGKSVLRVSIERPFYAAKAHEIPNLWRVI